MQLNSDVRREAASSLPAPRLSSALSKEKPLLSISVAFSGFQRSKQCQISPASSFCHSRPQTSPTKTQHPNLPTFTAALRTDSSVPPSFPTGRAQPPAASLPFFLGFHLDFMAVQGVTPLPHPFSLLKML